MKLSYQLTQGDYIEAAAARMKREKKNPVKRIRILLLILTAVALVPTMLSYMMQGNPPGRVLLSVAANPILWAIVLAMVLINERMAAKSILRREEVSGRVNAAWWEPQQVSLTAGSLLFSGADGVRQVKRTDIRSLIQTKNLLVLLMEDKDMRIIPKSAFPTAGELEDALRMLAR